MLQFDTLETTRGRIVLDGELITPSDPRHAQVRAHLAENDTPGPQVAVNEQARRYLANTDWYVTRHHETGEPIPADVTEARAAARAAIV
jgi:hypothetical protein